MAFLVKKTKDQVVSCDMKDLFLWPWQLTLLGWIDKIRQLFVVWKFYLPGLYSLGQVLGGLVQRIVKLVSCLFWQLALNDNNLQKHNQTGVLLRSPGNFYPENKLPLSWYYSIKFCHRLNQNIKLSVKTLILLFWLVLILFLFLISSETLWIYGLFSSTPFSPTPENRSLVNVFFKKKLMIQWR